MSWRHVKWRRVLATPADLGQWLQRVGLFFVSACGVVSDCALIDCPSLAVCGAMTCGAYLWRCVVPSRVVPISAFLFISLPACFPLHLSPCLRFCAHVAVHVHVHVGVYFGLLCVEWWQLFDAICRVAADSWYASSGR